MLHSAVVKNERFYPHREIFSEPCSIKPNFDCDYNFSIDLSPNGIPFGAQLIGQM